MLRPPPFAGFAAGILAATAVACGPSGNSTPPAAAVAPAPASPPVAAKSAIPFGEVQRIVGTHRWPAGLDTETAADREKTWPAWVRRHDQEIRARLERGDEDSLVNFWLYGTSFTTLPRATPAELARLGASGAGDLLARRLDNLIDGLASPGGNERLRFARDVVARKGIDPAAAGGRDRVKGFFTSARIRLQEEAARDEAAKGSADQSALRDRGLSADTSITADFALDKSFDAAKAKGLLGAGSVRRVAIVGPGLDFTDKAEGYDFYPQQTIQPFAVADSLRRLGLAGDDLRLTTFDLSPRVNQHLAAARERADRGEAYVVQLPLAADDAARQWSPDFVVYWQRFGHQIGENLPPIAAPPGEEVRVRAVRVRPAIAAAITPLDLNIVLERLPLGAANQFDIVIATNVLAYYDNFEQALALANIAAMLRPGGFFVTNYGVAPVAPMEPSGALITTVEFDRQHRGDTILWYQKQR